MAEENPAPSAIAIALIGADALLAARPATPVQVLHGCLSAGFAAAYPVTWGDELIARSCLSRLAYETASRVALCSCPFASRRIDDDDLDAERLAIAAPPVAAARLVRAAYGEHTVRITFIGGCPSAIDASIDAHVTPGAFLGTLRDRGIELIELPDVFEGVLPPDRRRFLSSPGGAPTSERLVEEGWRRVLSTDDIPTSDEPLLIDLAPMAGCLCAGGAFGRAAVEELEPPRSQSPVIDPLISVDMRPTPAFAPASHRVSRSRRQGAPSSDAAISVGQNVAAGDIVAEPKVNATQATEEDVVVGDGAGHRFERGRTRRHLVVGSAEPTLGGPQGPEEVEVEVSPASEVPGAPVLSGKVVDANALEEDDLASAHGHWPSPQIVMPDDSPPPSRRSARVAIGLGVALALMMPLAALGGWVLWRNGASALRQNSRSAVPQPVTSVPTVDSPSIVPRLDSARASAVASAASIDTVRNEVEQGRRVDSAGGQPVTTSPRVVASQRDRSVDRPARPVGSRRSSDPAARSSSEARPTQAMRPAPLQVGLPLAADSAASASLEDGDSTVSEREALMRDIAIRRARADSLARVVDSLKKVRTRPLTKP